MIKVFSTLAFFVMLTLLSCTAIICKNSIGSECVNCSDVIVSTCLFELDRLVVVICVLKHNCLLMQVCACVFMCIYVNVCI